MAYAILNGEVVGTFYNGKGARIKESFTKRDGTEGAQYFSAFFEEPHGLNEGDSGVFKGTFSASINEYADKQTGEPRYSAQVTLNNTKAEEIVYASDAEPVAAGWPAESGVPSGF
jgi:hypothetical protein